VVTGAVKSESVKRVATETAAFTKSVNRGLYFFSGKSRKYPELKLAICVYLKLGFHKPLLVTSP
jgi:hypothetical protein